MAALVRVSNFILFSAALFLLLPRGFSLEPHGGLDGSWQLALHLAREAGLIFGRDFVFTYGPLGTLTTRYAIENSTSELLAADIFLYANLIYIFGYLTLRSRTLLPGIAGLSYAAVATTGVYFMRLPSMLFFVGLFHLYRYLKDGGLLSLTAGSAVAIVTFYIKVNFGIAGLALLLAGICYRLLAHGEGAAFAGHLFVFAAMLGLSLLVMPVDPLGYVLGAVHLIDGYNDAMYLDSAYHRPLVLLTLLPITAYVIYMLVTIPVLFRTKDFAFLLLSLALALFLILKQSVVRGDEHVYEFFELAPLAAALFAIFSRGFAQKAAVALFVIFLGVSISVARYRFTPELFTDKLSDVQRYAAELKEPPISRPYTGEIPAAMRLPQSFLDAVTEESVDIIPTNIAAIFFNNLNYRPRPVVQSYAAFDGYLDRLNAEKYSAQHSPDFVIFSPECIDDRYCFFDETETKLALRRSFKIVDRADGRLLLARSAYPGKSTVKFLSSGQSPLSEPVDVPKHRGVLLMQLDVRYTPRGRIERTLFKPPPLRINIKLSDGSSNEYRAVLPIIRDGVIISHFVESPEEAGAFFSGDLSKLRRIDSIRLRSPGRYAYEPVYEYSFYTVEFAAE